MTFLRFVQISFISHFVGLLVNRRMPHEKEIR